MGAMMPRQSTDFARLPCRNPRVDFRRARDEARPPEQARIDMGWNFGGVVIDFDFRSVVDELLEPADRRFINGRETPEERRQKALMDVGTLVLRLLGYGADVADAPIEFSDAASASFEDYAVGEIGGKTIVLGAGIALAQETAELVERLAAISRERGAVLVFWFNDASGSYMFSVFRDGARVRFRSTGPGLSGDEGERVAGEPQAPCHGHDYEMAVLEAFVGRPFRELEHLQMERFDA
ncbi:hypothetical protein [Nannocystis punicea]|uniref:Uncharacterized protein n=1 Tax=Nannocystis punicea TaxID=2995304 RepID=A0ABY7H758_9BACT|nr:hypothetical protein [Nannocystis poenicansa]WAS95097.1 hypothetical protein O0S08_02960 [Nannocystis poenicansa]